MKHTLLILIIVLAAFSEVNAQVKSFMKPQATEFPLSTTFKVEIRQNAESYIDATVFKYNTPSGYVTKTENMAMFAFEPSTGPVTARISMLNGSALNENIIEVVNKSLPDMSWRFEDGKLLVTSASAKRQILVRLKADYGNQLLLMIDPLQERNIPEGAKVVRFTAAGSPHVQTAQYDRYSVPNDVDVVVVEEGAVLKGTVHTSGGRSKPLILMGRGIILGNGGVVSGSSGIPWNAIELNHGNNHIIDGITSISPRHFTIRSASNSLITNVKMFGYNANIDGIVAGTGSTIEYCYSKVNDDHIKLYSNNITVRWCNFYEQTNGGVFQFAWNSIKPGSNCLVENCEILAWEAGCGDPKLGQGGIARSFINLRSTDAGSTATNNIFRNIYIQGQMPRFVCINGKYDGSKPLTMTNLLLENITVEKKPSTYSWIYTGDPHTISITFKNVSIAGECLTAGNYQFNTEGNVVLNYESCGPADDEAPSIPQQLKADSTTFNSVYLSWSASMDNVGVKQYEIYADNVLKLVVTDNSGAIAGLQQNKTYEFKVRAVDAAGNMSAFSQAIQVTTPTCGDTEAPGKPGSLVADAVTPSTASLSWSASTDNVGVTSYHVYVDDVFRVQTAATSVLLEGLKCETTYSVKVQAVDLCGNTSVFSESTQVVTSECPACVVNIQGGNGAQEGQAPYATNNIPGRISAVNFDNGGQNVAYYESDGRATWAHPTFRTNELIDIDEADGSTVESGAVIGGISAGEWAEYTVNIAQAGDYNLSVRYGCNGNKVAYFKLDNEIIGCLNTFPSTGRASTYDVVTISTPFTLPAGEHVFAWVSESSTAFNFDWFEFSLANGLNSLSNKTEKGILAATIYRAGESIRFKMDVNVDRGILILVNIKGQAVKSQQLTGFSDVEFTLPENLETGIYFVQHRGAMAVVTEKIIVREL
jgi:chitodextrinase